MSLYFQRDEAVSKTPVLDYRSSLDAALPEIKSMSKESLDEIYLVVQKLKSFGVKALLESSKYYCDKLEKNYRGYFAIGSGFFQLFKMKDDIILMDRTNFSKEKFIELLRFFRYLSDGIKDINDTLINDIVNQKDLFTSLKPYEVQESHFGFKNTRMKRIAEQQTSLAKSIGSIIDSKAGIKVEFGRFFRNNFDNVLQAIKITLSGQRGDAEFIIYVPAMIKGVYSLGTNKFVMNKLYEDYVNDVPTNLIKRLIRSIVEGTLTFTKAYKISQENKEILRRSLQSAFNALLFAKREIRPNSQDFKLEMAMLGKSYEQAEKDLEANIYKFNPFTVIENFESSLTKFETIVEHHKLYFKEYVDPSKSTGSSILNNFGAKGYEKHRNFPLNNGRLDLFDPCYMNNKGDFVVAYLEDKTSLIEMNPWFMKNHQSFRNAGSAYIIGHAFEVEAKPELPLTISNKLIKYIPSYNMLFAFVDFVDSKGLSTYDGQRILNEKYVKDLGLFEGIKIAYQGFDKGVSRISTDTIECEVNGVRHAVNVASPINIASRLNFSVLYGGLYDAKKYFEGRTETETRDFTKKPLTPEELMDPVEIFVNNKSIGKHFVGLMQSFFVRDIDSSYKNDDLEDEEETTTTTEKPEFKTYKLGLEWFSRARLMGANRLVEYLLGTQEKIYKDIQKIESLAEGNLYGKNGKVTRRFQKEVTGFTSTVTANAYLPEDQANIFLLDQEFAMFLVGIKRIYSDFDVVKAKEAFDKGIPVFLPPALQLRNPSTDDANTVYIKVSVYKAPKYTKHGFSEVNPVVWQRQGGDFDGDQVIFLFFPYAMKKELKQFFSISLRDVKDYSFEFKARDIILGKPENIYDTSALHDLPSKYPYNNLETFIEWIAQVKKNKEHSAKLLELSKIDLTKKEALVKASSNLMTTRISKQLIGVAKTITMKATFFIEDFLNHFDVQDQNIKDLLRRTADLMNYKLVQPTIDIQKWADNLQEVIKTVLLVYRMSEAVSSLIEFGFYPTYRTYATIRQHAIKGGLITDTFVSYSGDLVKYDRFAKDKKISDKIPVGKMEYNYQGFLYGKKSLEDFAVEKNGHYTISYDITKAGWSHADKPKDVARILIDIINPIGNVFENILAFTEDDMENFNADQKFYVIK
jgi:hypothetical protein